MASIRKRGNTYYIDYRIGGKRIRKAVGTDYAQAQNALARIEAEQQAVKDIKPAQWIPLKKVFSEFRQYFKEIFSPNTQAKYNSILNNFERFLTKRFSYIDNIKDVSSDVFVRYREERLKDGVTPQTVNSELIILKKLFTLLVSWEYISSNPTANIDLLQKEKQPLPRILNSQEIKTLLDNASDWLYPILFTFLNAGLRKHELENLEWEDVDLEQRVIHVRHKGEWAAKEQDRDVPVNDALFKVLNEQKRRHQSPDTRRQIRESDLVFPDEHGLKIHHNRLRRHLMRLAKKCGLTGVTQIHILRHTFAARLIERGVSLDTVQELLGHNDPKTTMIYSHLKKADAKSAVEGLEF